MKENSQVTQLVYNINTLEWVMHLHVRGCDNRIKITADEASAIINSFTQDEPDRMDIVSNVKDGLVYYMPKPKK